MGNYFFGSNYAMLMDPVHGGIGAMEHEINCIDHPLFQRLRYILQNDVAQYVFSGTTHTRFGHSVGVMHLAGRLYRTLVEQYLSERGDNVEFNEQHGEAIYYIYCCFRLAALLHDTGHFPFSHEFEKTEEIEELLKDSNNLKKFWGDQQLCEKYVGEEINSSNFVAAHEDYSLAVAYKILSSVKEQDLLPVEIDDVLCLMEAHSHQYTEKWEEMCQLLFEVLGGKSAIGNNNFAEKVAVYINKFFYLMISGEVDVDKMDYLLRDSYFSGAKYGIYNLDHLLRETLKKPQIEG